MTVHPNYVDGSRESDGPSLIEVENPTTEAVLGQVPALGCRRGGPRAVRAARAAFAGWSATSPAERAAYLTALADALRQRTTAIAHTIAIDVGTPVRIAARVQAGLPITVLGTYAELLADEPREQRLRNSLIVREPVGVVAAITPVELPAAPDRRQARAGPGRGRHRGAQAERGRSAGRHPPDRRHRADRPARRGGQRGARHRAGRG